MPYSIPYTDTTNPSKVPITVADGTINTTTSLKFVGQSYPGYAEPVAEDFLHLLENFAAPTSPINPVQGQLWYDTSTNILKVYDGVNWTTAGSLKKSGTAPAVANSIAGDLWSNTNSNQLFLFTGSNWVLVGPQYSAGTQTGPIVETIIDTSNITHNVISMYANNYRIVIISKEQFIPKSSIAGFSTVYQGINLSTIDSTTATSLTRFWGTASAADALLVNNTPVTSANFLRSDTISTTNYAVNIRSDAGINIGSNLGLTLGVQSGASAIYSSNSGSNFNIKLTNLNGLLNTIVHVDPSGLVGIGINNVAPVSELDVAGTVTVSSGINVNGTAEASYTAGTLFTTASGSIVTQGGLSVGKKTILADDVTSYGQYFLNYLDANNSPNAAAVILPNYSTNSTESSTLNIPLVSAGLYDIGSSTRPFRNIYAANFAGNFAGTFTGILEGSASGSAAFLTSPTVFSLTGDVSSNSVSFNGQSTTGTAVFTTTLDPNFITNKTTVTDSYSTDTMLVYRPGAGLVNMTKDVLHRHLSVVPIGVILPFAGPQVPTGYLLCDGSEVSISSYTQLYSVIGYTYKNESYLQGDGTFALPDLRGRFPLGADNMLNPNNTVPSKTGGTLITTSTDLNGNPSTAAHRVNDVSANAIGAGNTSANGYVTLTSTNLPQHTHTLQSNAGIQYYAGSPPGSAADGQSVAGYGITGGSTGEGLPNSGGVTGATGVSVNVMNPYQTINYIIFTGNI